MTITPRTSHTIRAAGRLRARRKFLTAAALLLTAAGLAFAPAGRQADAQVVVQAPVVISQFYTRGGEAGSASTDDYVELFNRGSEPVDINGWTVQATTTEGATTVSFMIGVVSTRGFILGPGGYIRLPINPNIFGGLGRTSGRLALVRNNSQLPLFGCPLGQDPDIVDFVGYGTESCFEGGSPAPAPTLTQAALRGGGGCNDSNNNGADFALSAPVPRDILTPANPCAAAPGAGVIQFGVPQFDAGEADGSVQITVSRTGDTTAPATVEYFTADGTASDRRDYTTAWGTLRFAAGEQIKSFSVLVNADAYVEGDETINLVLSNPTGGAALGARSAATLILRDGPVFTPPAGGNPSDSTSFFVGQHYHDFLNREADAGGLQFWSRVIDDCETASCVRERRVDVSAAFFLSIEFQETGYFVHRLYRAALPERELRPRALPRYREFVRDTQEVGRGVVVGEGDWRARLEANRRAFLASFVARPEFEANYPAALSPADYVNKLNAQAGGVLSDEERAALTSALARGDETRATVLGKVADDPDFVRAEFNRAFVLMQYFGYLRRSPDDAPDANFDGYDFWLGQLESSGGDYRRAEMVRAFIESIEYRQRFAQ